MRTIAKKTWPVFFRLVRSGKKRADIRLADFRIAKGDVLLLREWNPRTKRYTGATLEKKVRAVHHVDFAKFHSLRDIRKHGLFLIEFT